jgi:hypothetical protein
VGSYLFNSFKNFHAGGALIIFGPVPVDAAFFHLRSRYKKYVIRKWFASDFSQSPGILSSIGLFVFVASHFYNTGRVISLIP